MGWTVQRTRGPAERFHHLPLPQPTVPAIWLHEVIRPALVLGSSQDPAIVDRDRASASGVEVCRRRSGGGLVYVDPATSRWIDVLIPAGHPRWDADVQRAFEWIGEAWATAVTATGANGVTVHRGATRNRAAGQFLCFAGLGSGEVSIDGRKIVGLSQRRTRDGARFQGLVIASWDSAAVRSLIRPEAWPAGLTPERVKAGHPLDLAMLPDAFVQAIEG